jgi:hypothetical protein
MVTIQNSDDDDAFECDQQSGPRRRRWPSRRRPTVLQGVPHGTGRADSRAWRDPLGELR